MSVDFVDAHQSGTDKVEAIASRALNLALDRPYQLSHRNIYEFESIAINACLAEGSVDWATSLEYRP